MKIDRSEVDLDAIDLALLTLLQENCKRPMAALGNEVGLSAPSVVERIHKLEEAGVIAGYTAQLNARRVGKDVAAFIGVSVGHPTQIDAFEREVVRFPDVLECHHVTGGYTLMLKVKVANTAELERLIDRIRAVAGVTRTETMVVLSTQAERSQIALPVPEGAPAERGRRGTQARPRRTLRRA
ncbi:MAG: Lrp/AsnC family transcriptional regulator [Deltaproteobacteria bacterium]|nr:MAG: Lrp/AsnC family transcriptional regulator [Deltaproteobacteria bacterium]